MTQLMPPPLCDPAEEAEKTMTHKLLEQENEEPTEYAASPASRVPPASFLSRDRRAALRARAAIGYRGLGG